MKSEIVLALISKMVEERLELFVAQELPTIKGKDGKDGKSFVFAEHEETIKSWAKEFALKFEDLSPSQMELLRGPQGFEGLPGPKGEDGKSFVFAEHEKEITDIISNAVSAVRDDLKLRFEDLSEDEKAELRGPRGQRGKPGKDFDFEESKDKISNEIYSHLQKLQPDLKLRFQDLTEEDKEELKLRFDHLTEEEKAGLKLRFEHLTDEEKESFKLKFEHLTEEDRQMLRGPRGQRGRAGRDGIDGKSIRGPIGPQGMQGPRGPQGPPGEDGKDAPVISNISLTKEGSDIFFSFDFDTGFSIITNRVKIPSTTNIGYVGVFGGGGGGSGPGGTIGGFIDGGGPEIDLGDLADIIDGGAP